jgi:hypothetical protein
VTTTWNNSKDPDDGSFSMKHPKKCSYTILKNPFKDKWGIMAKAWANKVLSKIKCVQAIVKNRWRDKV